MFNQIFYIWCRSMHLLWLFVWYNNLFETLNYSVGCDSQVNGNLWQTISEIVHAPSSDKNELNFNITRQSTRNFIHFLSEFFKSICSKMMNFCIYSNISQMGEGVEILEFLFLFAETGTGDFWDIINDKM